MIINNETRYASSSHAPPPSPGPVPPSVTPTEVSTLNQIPADVAREAFVQKILARHIQCDPVVMPGEKYHEFGVQFTNNVMPQFSLAILKVILDVMNALDSSNEGMSRACSILGEHMGWSNPPPPAEMSACLKEDEKNILSAVFYLHPDGGALWDRLQNPDLHLPRPLTRAGSEQVDSSALALVKQAHQLFRTKAKIEFSATG